MAGGELLGVETERGERARPDVGEQQIGRGEQRSEPGRVLGQGEVEGDDVLAEGREHEVGAESGRGGPDQRRGVASQPEPAIGLVAALSISASVVDSSPFSTNGALVVANAGPADQDRVYRQLMKWGMSLVAVVPVVTWLALVLPAS